MAGVKRIQLKRERGRRIPPNTAKVDRTTRFGNPFSVVQWPERAVALHRAWLTCELTDEMIQRTSPGLIAKHLLARRFAVHVALGDLRGKNLACWCKRGDPCHADLLLELANADVVDLKKAG